MVGTTLSTQNHSAQKTDEISSTFLSLKVLVSAPGLVSAQWCPSTLLKKWDEAPTISPSHCPENCHFRLLSSVMAGWLILLWI